MSMQRERNRDIHAVLGGLSHEEIPAEQLAAAARQLTSMALRAAASRADLVQILEMVGCIGPEIAATAIAAIADDETPLGLSEPLSASPGPRKPVVWGWCRKGRHRMTGTNVWHSPTTTKRRCRACGAAQRRTRTR